MGDIGRHFPDTSSEYKNIDSKVLLVKTNELIASKNYRIGNLDVTISAQKPKLKPFIPEMEETISRLLDIDVDAVSIKATTTEELGFEGREEGISVHAVVLLVSDITNKIRKGLDDSEEGRLNTTEE
ncbi:MAG: 2-C-methyl-D-erythritol 2 4-cyclodiphosphate, partial [Prolixibacteraceae bacterium]